MDQESEQEGEAEEEVIVEVTIVNEYRNVRALQGSIGYINKATASGHKPHLYHLAETWWETDKHPILDEYTLIAYCLATRDYSIGRGKGGMAIYKHKDCATPTRRLPFSEPIENAIATAIGGAEDELGNIVVIAFYLAKCSDYETTKYFNKLAKEIKIFEEQGYHTFLVGDGNANRKKDGTPRDSCFTATALIRAEELADLRWLCPQNDGPCFTRYNISKEIMEQRDNFDPASATSAVDHDSAGRSSIQHNITESYTLNEDLHLGADHVGLLLVVKALLPDYKPLTHK